MNSNRYNQRPAVAAQTRFTDAAVPDLEFSRFTSTPSHITTFNAGDIVPIGCFEVLPHDTFEIDMSFVIRQTTVLTPTMGEMFVDFYAFEVPNRVVNESWKNVMGENSSGRWVAPDVSLVPLYNKPNDVQIPIGSVADYYGFPTQALIPGTLLNQMHDLKFRGYLEIYNNHFRDQNYQPPIPFSRLNLYNGFLESKGSQINLTGDNSSLNVAPNTVSDGGFGRGSVVKAVFGEGSEVKSTANALSNYLTSWSALDPPLKANKKHDYFTSVLPSPQKGPEVVFKIADNSLFPVVTGPEHINASNVPSVGLKYYIPGISPAPDDMGLPRDASAILKVTSRSGLNNQAPVSVKKDASYTASDITSVYPSNLHADLSSVSLSLNDIRYSSAVQQVYEILARGGSRYREYINAFFGLDTDNPFSDISVLLGHISRNLDLYQTAQTSQSVEGGTPQGNLSAFGYTSNGGRLFKKTFLEHGYVHIFAVVRHKNLYSTYLGRDNFRLNSLDFYVPQLANISEQPVYTREINPFASSTGSVFGYNEAWAEYRFDPDRVSGYMRPGINGSLSIWNYADDFDSTLTFANDNFMKSNSQQVLQRSLAVDDQPQFKGFFRFAITKQRPMPTYSVPGLDII